GCSGDDCLLDLDAGGRGAARRMDLGRVYFHGVRHQRARSEEHTSELQSLRHLVCRLVLEKNEKIRFIAVSFCGDGENAIRVRWSARVACICTRNSLNGPTGTDPRCDSNVILVILIVHAYG